MITITSVLGNLRLNQNLHAIYQKLNDENKVERVFLSRMDAGRSRIRRISDAGTDIAISLEHDNMLKHGDILLLEENKMVVVEYEPEDVLSIKIKDELASDEKIAIAIKLGHIIGNLHRPISIKDNITYIPLQSESEVENIKKILLPIIHYIEIQHERIIFEQEEGIGVHTH